MDVSELLPILGALIVVVLAAACFRRLRLLPNRRNRLLLRTLTGAVGVVFLLAGLAALWFDTSYTRRLAPVISPDGRHRALVSYTVGDGSGTDQAEVAIRASWSPYAHGIYAGPAHFDPHARTPEPEVTWLDSSHLSIRFHTYVGNNGVLGAPQGCAAAAEGITIVCEEDRVHAVR